MRLRADGAVHLRAWSRERGPFRSRGDLPYGDLLATLFTNRVLATHTRGATELMEFLKKAFGAVEKARVDLDGYIAHAEMTIGDSVVMLFDAKPEWPDTPSFIRLFVDDGDALFERAARLAARAPARGAAGGRCRRDGDGGALVRRSRGPRARSQGKRLVDPDARRRVYVTPGAQSPTGVTMSAGRRSQLLALADEHQAPILEDDYDGELRYEPPAVAALKSLDSAGRVVYAGTFSKVLFPILRVGYVVVARPLLETMVLATSTRTSRRASSREPRSPRSSGRARSSAISGACAGSTPSAWPQCSTRSRGRCRPAADGAGRGVGTQFWLRLPAGLDPDAVFQGGRRAGDRVHMG